MWFLPCILLAGWVAESDGSRAHFSNISHEFTTPADEIGPMLPDEGMQTSTVVAGLMPDSFAEMFNFLDGDSFGIGKAFE
ncbi:jg22324 [Pararge aegeria aegeria]|uniref:Jg22324 protein n=1 Tax=Pararge aegeria aegeria TaxID=348720 RepID=A0A8S4QTX5_9NEOP|nr:jg22324 [Pararge aegeria aegeria]